MPVIHRLARCVPIPDWPDGSPHQLKVSLLRDQVTDLLREAIVSMRLKPGQQLVERELVEMTGVSRATIRESLRQLAAEGLVTTIPQRGTAVAVPGLREVEELYEVRALVEGLVTRQFAERASTEQRQALRHEFEELKVAAARSGNAASILAAKTRFYRVLFDGASNTTARNILEGLQARMTMCRAISVSRPGRLPVLVEEIRRIVEAIEAGDAGTAEEASNEHIRTAGRNVLEELSNPVGSNPVD